MKKNLTIIVFAASLRLMAWTPIALNIAGAPGAEDYLSWPSPDTTVAGLALTGFGEYADVYGLNLGITQAVDTMYGFQLGTYNGLVHGFALEIGFVNCMDAGGGLQIGLANLADDESVTTQIGLYNGPMALTHGFGGAGGLQIGLINNSYRGKHVQIGLYNNAEYPEWCFQVGLFCKRNDFGFLLLGWHF